MSFKIYVGCKRGEPVPKIRAEFQKKAKEPAAEEEEVEDESEE